MGWDRVCVESGLSEQRGVDEGAQRLVLLEWKVLSGRREQVSQGLFMPHWKQGAFSIREKSQKASEQL